VTALQCFVAAVWPLACFLVLRLIQIRDAAAVETLEMRISAMEKRDEKVIEGDEPQWVRDQGALVFGQEVVIQIVDDISFKATFQGVDVGIDGSPWIVFKAGEAPAKMLPVSRVYVSACEAAK
jgi:hypothetical protein